jgi:hypothetical protein
VLFRLLALQLVCVLQSAPLAKNKRCLAVFDVESAVLHLGVDKREQSNMLLFSSYTLLQ